MSDPRIRAALEAHLEALAPALPTAWQDREFEPPDSAPYQEAFVIPGPNQSLGLKQRTALIKGIFQINLCYPSGGETDEIEARGRVVQQHFHPETTVLESDGVKVRIAGLPVIGAPVPGRPGRYVVPVSIRFTSIT
jgi:hypothetical protein